MNHFLKKPQCFYCDSPHIFAGTEHFLMVLQLPDTTVSLVFVLKCSFIWHLHSKTQIPGRGGKNHCLQLCLQGPAGQEMLLSGDSLVKTKDFCINCVGYKFSSNSEREFRPTHLSVAQIIVNSSSGFCTLFLLHLNTAYPQLSTT